MKKVLIAEDEKRIQKALVNGFDQAGYVSIACSKVAEIISLVEEIQDYDLFVLDRVLYGEDSVSIIPYLKGKCPNSFIVIISAINTPDEKASLIDLGADDYLGKPISLKELLARVNALFRRNKDQRKKFAVVGNTIVDYEKRFICVGSKKESLTNKEFLVFKTLSQDVGRNYTRVELYDLCWGGNMEIETNVVEATITSIRRKLEHCGSDAQLKNARGVGYWLEI